MSIAADIQTKIVPTLVKLGHKVVFVPGWSTRGKGEFRRLRYRLNHHDAFPARSGHAGGLRTCTYGRPGLRNALCMFYLASDGVIYVVAAKPSWHAGAGTLTNNYESSGSEARNDGLGEPWPDVQVRANLDLDAVCAIVWGVLPYEHKEHAPRRKIDRTGFDGPSWRRRVDARVPEVLAVMLGHTPGPNPPEEEFIVRDEDKETIRKIVEAAVDTKVAQIREWTLRELVQNSLVIVKDEEQYMWLWDGVHARRFIGQAKAEEYIKIFGLHQRYPDFPRVRAADMRKYEV